MLKRKMHTTSKTHRWCHSQLFFVAELVDTDKVSHHRHLVTERKFKILIMNLMIRQMIRTDPQKIWTADMRHGREWIK